MKVLRRTEYDGAALARAFDISEEELAELWSAGKTTPSANVREQVAEWLLQRG